MGKDTGIKMVEKKIVSFISKSSVYTVSDLRKIFKDKRKEWSLPDSMNFQGFLEELKSAGLAERRFLDYNGLPFKTLYTLGDFDHFECACKLYKNAYLSHHTALFMNNLTEQIPKTIYVSYELSPKTGGTDKKLSQKDIDRSFAKPVREPQSFSFLRQEIVVHASKYNGNIGIVPHNTGNFSFTDTERTLIDSVVRPELSGGVFNVLNVFTENRGGYSPEKLRSYLSKLNYTYPYHQAIGFYLERAGFSDAELSKFEDPGIRYKFYLDRDIISGSFSKRWNLVYPSEIE
jgi:predicted transcriptional regulator of viral defense system